MPRRFGPHESSKRGLQNNVFGPINLGGEPHVSCLGCCCGITRSVDAIVGLFPWYDRVHPCVLGFPFLYFWMFLWFPLTALCLLGAWLVERSGQKEELSQ